ncbi:oxidoreductase [Leifsonia sp. Root227]|uniref:Gfo/Idh/MocA family protein n=1 Tax=unclassified Leifsonia TaxID=2663824 RepID=UPI0006F5CEFB|nr:Gfo/Idh/MocA family oxidoreductase [Leifsonia sp. Root227]KRC50712.1 oxidoreductase [Leifsonia sp. Root227]
MTSQDAGAPLRLAVIGVGARSYIAGHAVDSGAGVIVAVADPSATARARAAEAFGDQLTAFPGHRELIEARDARGGNIVDAAFVTSPDHTHAEIAIDLLRAGIAVYLEKPLAISLEDADAILAAAAESGSKLYVGHNMRHMAVVTLMRDIIKRGEIGEVKAVWCRHFVGNGGDYYFKDWHAERAKSNGLLLQKGAHDIDIIHWLAGGYSELVTGMGGLSLYGGIDARRDNSDRSMPDWFSLEAWPPLSQTDLNPVIDVEDISMVNMRLDNGVYASYQQCHYTPDYWRNYTVIGTEGRLENFGDTDGAVVRVWNTRTLYDPVGDAEYRVNGDERGHRDADRLTVAEFIRFVTDGSRTETSAVAARNAVATAVAATESIRDGSRPIAVPAVDEHVATLV